MIKQFILCYFLLFCFLSVSAEASGAAARRGNVNVQGGNVNIQGGKKTYRVNSIPQPGVWPTPKQPEQKVEEQVEEEAPEQEIQKTIFSSSASPSQLSF